MQYTPEELMDLPLHILTNVDIRNKEEENLVQSIINKKRVEENTFQPASFPSGMTDNMTIEKERELQARIDAENARRMRELTGESEGLTEEEAEDPQPSEEPVAVIAEIPTSVETIVVTEAIVATGIKCTLCGTRGYIHKNGCEKKGEPMTK